MKMNGMTKTETNLTTNIMKTFILKENVLTDNLLMLTDKGKVFKGGYIARIKEYSFATSWSDKETIKNFRSKHSLFMYLNKYYSINDIDFTGTNLE